jgi:hypothetical protein
VSLPCTEQSVGCLHSIELLSPVFFVCRVYEQLLRAQTRHVRLLAMFIVYKVISNRTTDSNVGAAYWTAAECNVAIICACLPFLRPLISRIFPRLLSTKSYNKYTGQPTMGTANRSRRTQLYSRDRDYGLYTIDIEATDVKRGSTGGIEVTTEMTVQESSQHDESTSQRRLVMQ